MANLASRFISVINPPNGVWEKIIMAFENGIPNYIWAIIILTLVIKLVMLPFDFLNRYITAKNTRLQAVIQPEIDKINKQYGANKQLVNQKTMEVYKKHNYNVTGSCFIMLINLALSLFIFITLFSGLNSMAAYKIATQYNEIQKSYYQVEDYSLDNLKNKYSEYYVEFINANKDAEGNYDSEQADVYAKNKTKEYIATFNTDENNLNAKNRYKQVKESWLWVDNIWKPDTPWTNSVATFDDYVSGGRISFKNSEVEVDGNKFTISASSLKELSKEEYNQIMNPIRSTEGKTNGYLIIVILATGANVFTMLMSQGKIRFKKKKKTKLEEEPKQKQTGGIIMAIIIPAIMLYFTMVYNAVFSVYILASSLFSIATTPLINYLVNLIEKKKEEKKKKEITVSYSRKK